MEAGLSRASNEPSSQSTWPRHQNRNFCAAPVKQCPFVTPFHPHGCWRTYLAQVSTNLSALYPLVAPWFHGGITFNLETSFSRCSPYCFSLFLPLPQYKPRPFLVIHTGPPSHPSRNNLIADEHWICRPCSGSNSAGSYRLDPDVRTSRWCTLGHRHYLDRSPSPGGSKICCNDYPATVAHRSLPDRAILSLEHLQRYLPATSTCPRALSLRTANYDRKCKCCIRLWE